MSRAPKFYQGQVCLNVLANTVDNAMDCYDVAEGHIVLGVLSKKYASNQSAIDDMKQYQEATNNALSIGLGAGDPNQSTMVTRLTEELNPKHVNQVFTGVGGSRAVLKQEETFINGPVSPTGKVGYVNIATGPLSSKMPAAEVTIALLKDMGGSSVKYFSMNGLVHLDEYKAVAKACAKMISP